MKNTARLYHCAGCQCQIIICSHCDRGNLYCGSNCSQFARIASLRAAGRRYQSSLPGRQKHAERQRRYRQRQKEIVTHQGSLDSLDHDLLPHEPNSEKKYAQENITCHFCGSTCSSFLRRSALSGRSSFTLESGP